MNVRDDQGREYELSDEAVAALRDSFTAREAERAFNAFAEYVPAMSRCGVWLAIDRVVVDRQKVRDNAPIYVDADGNEKYA